MSLLLNLKRPPYRTYSITQLCREFGATPRALRFYEEQGLLSPARRDTARVYSYKDRARLQLILRGRRVGQDAEALRIHRKRIEELQAQRAHVDEAIEELRLAARHLTCKYPELSTDAGKQPAG